MNTHKKLARAHIQLKIGDAVRINTLEGCHEILDNSRKSTGRFTTNRDRAIHAVSYDAPRAQDFPVRCHILDHTVNFMSLETLSSLPLYGKGCFVYLPSRSSISLQSSNKIQSSCSGIERELLVSLSLLSNEGRV